MARPLSLLGLNLFQRADPPPKTRRPDQVIDGVPYFSNRGVLLPIIDGIFSEQIAASVRAEEYEMYEAAELDSLIQPGEVILEIGAGCGFLSTYCAINPHTRRVACVEANPRMIEVIKLTHRANAVDIDVFHEILAAEDGETDFFVHQDFWASGTHDFLGTKIRVRTTAFGRRLAEVRPSMLVVDIEGGEQALFRDVDLSGVRKILIELHQPTIGRRGIKEVFDCLSAQGFHYDTWHSNRNIVTFSHVDRI